MARTNKNNFTLFSCLSSINRHDQDKLTHTSFEHIFKKSCQVALSIGLSRVIQMLSAFIGMFMVAHLGHNELAASALVDSYSSFSVCCRLFLPSVSWNFNGPIIWC